MTPYLAPNVLALLMDFAKIHTMKAELASRRMLEFDLEVASRPPLENQRRSVQFAVSFDYPLVGHVSVAASQ